MVRETAHNHANTVHNSSMVMKTCRTWLPSTERENVEKPLTVDRYNTYMAGVDESD